MHYISRWMITALVKSQGNPKVKNVTLVANCEEDTHAYFHEHERAAGGEENQTTASVDAFAVARPTGIDIIVRRNTVCMLCVRSFRQEHVLAEIRHNRCFALSHMHDAAR